MESVLRVVVDKQLNGIDVDWGHPQSAAEEETYADRLQDLQEAFAPRDLALTATVTARQRIPLRGIQAVDFVQVMAYDHVGEHATLALPIDGPGDARRSLR